MVIGVVAAGGDAGWAQKTTDPRGLITKANYDAVGRPTQTVENLTDGVVRAEENPTTHYAYDGDDRFMLMTPVQPGAGVQETKYNYLSRIVGSGEVIE